jgi:putative peptidoglycan lipid II flippase
MSKDASPSASSGSASSKERSSNGSFLVSLGILLSRILGLVRDQVFAHYLGNSPAAAAFRAALRIPNFLQNLFGEGVLSASFIPVYSRLRAEHSDEEARRVAGAVGAILALTVSVLVLFGVILTPSFVDLVAPGFDGELRELTVQIVRILFPGVGLLVLSAWCLGILNSHRKFFLSYVAPVFWNLALIATLWIFGRSSSQESLVVYLAWGSVIGSALQFAVQVPFVFRSAGAIPFSLGLRLNPVREIFRNLGPVLVSRGVVQLSAYIDAMIASYLGAAAVASLAYAQTIYLLPVSLFGMAVAAAELPELSVTAGASLEAHRKLCERIRAGRARIAYFVVPSVVAIVLLGRELVTVLYQTGHFSPDDTVFVWFILLGSVIGLLAATWGRLYSSAFYALRDTKTPLYFAILRVFLTLSLGVLFAFPLRPWITQLIVQLTGTALPNVTNVELGMGAVGLTASAGLAGWIEFLLLKFALEKRIGSTAVSTKLLLQIWSIALLAGAIGVVVSHPIRAALENLARSNFIALGPIAVFGVIYLGLTYIFKVGEARQLARLFKKIQQKLRR